MSVTMPTPNELLVMLAPHWHHKPLRRTVFGRSPATAITADLSHVVSNDITALCGFWLAETTNAAGAAVRFWDGNSSSADLGLRVNLATNESTREFWWPQGIELATGHLYLQVVSGSIEGGVFWV